MPKSTGFGFRAKTPSWMRRNASSATADKRLRRRADQRASRQRNAGEKEVEEEEEGDGKNGQK